MKKDGSGWYLGFFGLLTFALVAYMVYPFLEGIIYGIFIYYITRPTKRRINAMINKNAISSLLALLIVVSLIVLPALISATYIADTAYKGLPKLIETIKGLLPEEYGLQIDEFINKLEIIDFEYFLELLQSQNLQAIIIEPIRRITEVFFWFIFTLFIALVVSFYLLLDGERFMRWFRGVIPKRDKEVVGEYLKNLDCSLDRIFVGVFLTMLITLVFALISLTLLNAAAPPELKLSAAIILGLAILCGIFNLLPGIGIKIVWVPMVILFGLQAYFTGTLMSSLWFLLIFAVVMAFVVDFIPDQILRPYICSSGIHTGIILLSFIFGTAVFGAKGLFLGPMILAAFAEFMAVVMPELGD